MREVVAVTQITLDGVMQAPGGPEEDPTGGFAHGGWSVRFWDEDLGRAIDEAMPEPFDLLLGRKTYEIFAAHWPYADDEIAEALNGARKHVASTTLGPLEWENSVLLEGDLAGAVAGLKAEDGPELQVHGSWNLLQSLIRLRLVDEYRLSVFPVVVGAGKRLFGDDAPALGLEPTATRVTSSGVLVASYRPTGPLETGSFAFEEPTEAEVQRREGLRG